MHKKSQCRHVFITQNIFSTFFKKLLIGCFSAAAAQLKQTITKELKYEQENYQRPGVVSDFMAKDNWSFVEKEGDVNMTLKKELDGKDVHIE